MFKYRAAILLLTLSFIAGAVHAAPEGRIVGGRDVSITKHPYTCSLRYRSCQPCKYLHSCGAALLSGKLAITSAHCLIHRDASNLLLVAGSDNRNGGDGIVSRIDRFILHDDYDDGLINNDVGLVYLQTPIKLDDIYTASIPVGFLMPPEGTPAVVTGFGSTSEGGSYAPKLQEVTLQIVSHATCEWNYGHGTIKPGMLCAGIMAGGFDACQGDSGAPLVVDGMLTGIVSWGRGCARPNYPGIYANIPFLKPWIDKHLAESNQQ